MAPRIPQEGARSPEGRLVLRDPVDRLGPKRKEIARKLLGIAARASSRVSAKCNGFKALRLEISNDQDLLEGLVEALTDNTIEYADGHIDRVERWARQQLATRQ